MKKDIITRIRLAAQVLTADAVYVATRRGDEYYNGWDCETAEVLNELNNLNV